MFNLGTLASVLNSMDSAAKETIEDINKTVTIITQNDADNISAISANQLTATQIRAHNKRLAAGSAKDDASSEDNLVSLSSREAEDSAVNVELVDGNVVMSDIEQSSPSAKKKASDISRKTVPLPTAILPDSAVDHLTDNEQYSKILKKKDQEIENLNRECLELEEQCKELKLEVREAWDNYRVAQERAAGRETELQDDIKRLQGAKATDRQQMVLQMNQLNEEIAAKVKQVLAAQQERDALQAQLTRAEQAASQSQQAVQRIEQELREARSHSVQGVQSLADELSSLRAHCEQVQRDHASVLRASQARQSELERENLELAASLADKQKEVNRLLGGGVGNMSKESGDLLSMQQELLGLSRRLQQECERSEQFEQRARVLECEVRAQQLTAEEDKRRASALASQYASQVSALEEKLRAQAESARKQRFPPPTSQSWPTVINEQEGSQREGSGLPQARDPSELSVEELARLERELRDSQQQAQHLSQLLLRKQTLLLELQAEKASLSSRLADKHTKCVQLEKKLAAVTELEGDELEGDLEDGAGEDSASEPLPSSLGLQQRRRLTEGSPSKPGSGQVLSDLERMGVKPSPVVSRAVTMIDSWTMLTGRFLRSYSLFRLGFVLYLLVLHLWVMFILVVHIHSLEADLMTMPIPPTNKLDKR